MKSKILAFLFAFFVCLPAYAQYIPGPGSGGGGGSPGGSNGQIQYNNSGAFGGLTNTAVATRVGPVTTVVNGNYAVVAGGNQYLQAITGAIITLPLSTASTGTVVTIQNLSNTSVTIQETPPDAFQGTTSISPNGIIQFTPSTDGTNVGWGLTNIVQAVLPVSSGGTGAATLTGVLVGNGTNPLTAGNLSVSNGGTGAVTLTGAVVGHGTGAFTAGTLSVPNGGTGASTFTSGQLLTGTGTSAVASLTGTGAISLSSGTPTVGTLGVANGGTGATTFTSGQILKGAGTGAVTSLTGTGAVSLSSGTPTVGTLSVPNGGSGATTLSGVVFGNGTSAMTALTDTQLTTHVNAFSSTLSGAAPLSGGGTTNFLRADGTWAAPTATVAAPLNLKNTTDVVGLSIEAETVGQTANIFEVRRGSDSYPGLAVDASSLNTSVYNLTSTGSITCNGTVNVNARAFFANNGTGLQFQAGSNSSTGSGTLSGGTVTISNTLVTANSKILLVDTTTGSLVNVGSLVRGAITPGTGFVVTSTNALDTSTFDYFIFNSY